MTRPTDELENLLVLQTGFKPGPRPRTDTRTLVLDPTAANLIREWLRSLGVPEYKFNTMAHDKLANCYSAGRNWVTLHLVNENRSNSNLFGRSKTASAIDLNLGFSKTTNALLDENGTTTTTNTNTTTSNPPIDPNTIASAADAVITPRIEKARQELAREINTIVRGTVDAELQKSLSTLDLNTHVEATFQRLFPSIEKNILSIVNKAADDAVFTAFIASAKTKANLPTNESETIETEISIDPSNIAHCIPKIDPDYYFDPYASRVITKALSRNKNVFIYGDMGCGKTTHIEQIHALLHRGMLSVDAHNDMTANDFRGGMKLIKGETLFIDGILIQAMKLGVTLVINEFTRMPSNLTAILHSVGEKGTLYVPETGEFISPNPGFCIFATDNTGGKGDRNGQYTGTEVQNGATLDRFSSCLRMDYLPFDKELAMLRKKFPLTKHVKITNVLRLATDIRVAFSRGELSITLSTRKIIELFEQHTIDNFTLGEALGNTLLNWLDEDDKQLITTMIDRLDFRMDEIEVPVLTNLQKLTEFIQNDQKISAIKLWRKVYNTDLTSAKNLVLAIFTNNKTLPANITENQIWNERFVDWN